MAFKPILFLTVLFVLGVSVSGDDKKACIKGKFEQSIGQPFTACFQAKQSVTELRRIKDCYQDKMKEEGVVRVASNGQMTVDRQKFGAYASQNNNNAVGRAMKSCYDAAPAGDRMYQEAARASQCVFEKVKATC